MKATDTPPATAELEQAAAQAEGRRGFLIALPSYAYLVLFFAVPLLIVFVYSFATRSSTGRTLLEGWNLESYKRLGESLVVQIALRSLLLAVVTTVICLVV
jgi:spermidine/putrescine transport system permease protein